MSIALNVYSVDDNRVYEGQFKPVRTVDGYTLGWLTVESEDYSYTFPAIHAPRLPCKVLTVSDWQAPWADYDLADKDDVAYILRTGSGQFRYAKPVHHNSSASGSAVPYRFAK